MSKTWELRVQRLREQTSGVGTRTVGSYEVLHDGKPVSHTVAVDGFEVPLFGTTAESCEPSQNDKPATQDQPSRIVAKSYQLAISGGPTYVTHGYRKDVQIKAPMPGIELLGTGNRTAILVHPGKDEFLSSIGCINLCTKLPDAGEIINYIGSRRRVIALIEDMKSHLGPLPTADLAPIPGASIAIDETILLATKPAHGLAAAPVLPKDIGWPLERNVIRRQKVNNTFGFVRNGGTKPHQGWDFEAVDGTPCFAIAKGKCEMVYSSSDYGKVAVLAFPFRNETLYAAYAHLSAIDVQPGDKVGMGQRIGLTGNTGNAMGMKGPDQHLHFEIRQVPRPGKGLSHRLSPAHVFGLCPLKQPIVV